LEYAKTKEKRKKIMSLFNFNIYSSYLFFYNYNIMKFIL